MPENENLTEYYSNLLIIQYSNKTNAVESIKVFVGGAMVFDLINDLRNAFDVETALGVQLDVLAKYVGAARLVFGVAFDREYFGYCAYGDTTPFLFSGYMAYGAAVPDVQIRDYNESVQSKYELTDEELRMLIKLAIVKNFSNGSLKDIDDGLLALFGTDIYVEETDNMIITYYLTGSQYQRIFNVAASIRLLPAPSGVWALVNVV